MATTVLRPRLDAVVVIGGEQLEVTTRLVDMMKLKGDRKGADLTGDGEDTARLVYLAGIRQGLWNGPSFEAWLEQVEDIEVYTAPPLADGASSPASSPPSLGPPASPPTTSPA